MRSHIRRHTYSDSHRSITEMIWEFSRKHHRLFERSIKVISPVYRILLQICKHFFCNLGQSRLGIPHRSCSITINRTKVSLPINERISERPWLRHTNHRFINRRITVRMVFSHHISDNSRRFFVLLVVEVVHLIHSKEDSPKHWLESISRIWQRTRNNHWHRIINVRLRNFFFYRMSNQLFITWLKKFFFVHEKNLKR